MRAGAFWVGLVGLLALGVGVRAAIIASPLGEIDGDEAVVGLMARHIAFLGERPVFYYGQPYLGSLEAFSAAPLFRLFDSSSLLLKLVPTAYSLAFLVTSAALARRLFGSGPALATAAYLAVPPAMWAVWSTKARGGYAEVLFLGELVLLLSLLLAERRDLRLALLWGLVAGLALWTHLLAVVYVVPAVAYLALWRRGNCLPSELGLALGGGLVGLAPLLFDNVANGWTTLRALTQPPDIPLDVPAQFARFFRVGVPVLLGLGQPTTSETLFDADWGQRPAGHLWVALLALGLLAVACVVHLPALRALLSRTLRRTANGGSEADATNVDAPCGATSTSAAGPALLLLVALVVPPVVAATRFGFFVAEPRYALPLYATVPLLIAAVWRLPIPLRAALLAGLLVFNVWSVVSTDPRLWRPEDAPDSTAATRAELVAYVVAQDRHQLYTDYWIGYPVMFETRETVLAYVISGGFNRYLPPADNVQRTPNPAWVFVPGTEAEQTFLSQLAQADGHADVAQVATYRVYTNVEPLAALRPHT